MNTKIQESWTKTKHKIPERGVGSFPENQLVPQLIFQRQVYSRNQILLFSTKKIHSDIDLYIINKRVVNAKLLSFAKKIETLQELLEDKLQKEEQEGADLQNKGTETGAIARAAEDPSVVGREREKKDTACAILADEDDKKHSDNPSSQTNENLLTFSRQKLALLQCEYDPKRCGFCREDSSVTKLKQCTKCKTAKYCSRECQSKDWKERHKKDCKEIRRLQENIRGTPAKHTFTAQLSDQPHFLKKSMDYSELHFHEGKLLLSGYQPNKLSGKFIDVYNPVTFEKENTVCRIEENFAIGAFCSLTIENSLLLAVSIISVPINKYPSRIELWPFPVSSRNPIYTFTIGSEMYGPMCYFEGRLLIWNEGRGTLDELDASSIPLRPTGLRVPTGILSSGSVQSMCLITNNSEKHIVLQYLKDEGWEDSRIKCINFEGQELWKVGGLDAPRLDGIPFQPYGICVDEEGNLYSAEQESDRVVVIKKDLTIQTLFCAPSRVGCVGWCDETQELYVVYDISEREQMAVAGYKIENFCELSTVICNA